MLLLSTAWLLSLPEVIFIFVPLRSRVCFFLSALRFKFRALGSNIHIHQLRFLILSHILIVVVSVVIERVRVEVLYGRVKGRVREHL